MPSYDNKVLTGDQLVYFSGLVKTALAEKASTSAVSAKQDALVFNTAYNASTNKVATMADIPTVDWNEIPIDNTSIVVLGEGEDITLTVGEVPATQVALGDPSPSAEPGDQIDLQTYVQDYINPSIANKQDALVFNTAYNATTNKVATMSDINTAIGGISSFSFEIVNSLPATGSSSKIYLVAKSSSGTNQVYTEYIYVNNAWEIIGDTQMTIDTLSNAEVQTIWNTASAT